MSTTSWLKPLKSSSRKVLSLTFLCLLLSHCIHTPIEKVKYSYLDEKSILFLEYDPVPLTDVTTLVVLRQPHDFNSKFYLLNQNTRKLSLLLDPERNIKGLFVHQPTQSIYFYLDNQGGQFNQIYELDIKNKTINLIFGFNTAESQIIDASLDGENLYIISNFKQEKVHNIYEYNKKKATHRLLTKNRFSFSSGVLSHDEKFLALSLEKNLQESELYLLNLMTLSLSRTLSFKDTKITPRFFHPEENTLYFDADIKSEFQGCYYTNLNNPMDIKPLFIPKTKHLSCYYDKTKNISFIKEHSKGSQTIRPFRGVFTREYLLPRLLNTNFIQSIVIQPNGKDALAYFHSFNPLPNIIKFNLYLGDDDRMKQVSLLDQSEKSLKNKTLSTLITFKSNGNQIETPFFFKREWKSLDQKIPLIIYLKGNSNNHSSDLSFDRITNYFVQNNFAVATPNYTGSINLGKNFEVLNNKNRQREIDDIENSITNLKEQSFIDPDRVFLVGENHGANILYALLSKKNTVARAAFLVNIKADYLDKGQFLELNSSQQGEFITEFGDPQSEKDQQQLKNFSPSYLDSPTNPLFIVYFKKNKRSTPSQMDQLFSQVHKKNSKSQLVPINNGSGIHSLLDSKRLLLEDVIYFFKNY